MTAYSDPRALLNDAKDLYLDTANSNTITKADMDALVGQIITRLAVNPDYDVHSYGAKGDAVGLAGSTVDSDQRTISNPYYTFTAEDVGKSVYVNHAWRTEAPERTIQSVSGGEAYLDATCGISGVGIYILVGTDDTAAFDAAVEAASTSMLTVAQEGLNDPVSYGGVPTAATIRLRSGRGYLLKNTQTRYDAGNHGAITLKRHVGIVGGGSGQTAVYIGGGNVGQVIANRGASRSPLGADESMQIAGLSIYCNGAMQDQTKALDGIHINTNGLVSFTTYGYTETVALNYIIDVKISQAVRDGLYIAGMGEVLVAHSFIMDSFRYGLHASCQDHRFVCVNAGGSYKTGFRITGAPSSQFIGCKSYYSGRDGGTNAADSGNWYIQGENGHSLKGQTIYTGCESQESRGSGWLIEGSLNIFDGCLSSDPKRNGLISGTLPTVAAAFELKGANCKNNIFIDCYARPALNLSYVAPYNHYGGTNGVYIHDEPSLNVGNIHLLPGTVYDDAAQGGAGITNQKNPLLKVNGEYLVSSRPDTPSSISGSVNNDGDFVLTWDIADDGGRKITDRRIRYKLTADSDWTEIYSQTLSAEQLYTFTSGLTFGLSYDFQIKAINANGETPWSSTYTTTVDYAVPGAPTGLVLVNGYQKLFGTFAAPVLTGGKAISDYVVEYSTDNANWSTFSDGTSTATSFTLTGLSDDTLYYVRVKAVNEEGTGAASTAATGTTQADYANIESANLLFHMDASKASTITADGSTLTAIADRSNLGNAFTVEAGFEPSTGTRTVNSLNALDFDGVNDYLQAPSSLNFLPGSDFTLHFVVKLDKTTGVQSLLDNVTSHDFLMYYREDTTDHVFTFGSGTISIADDPTTNTHVVTLWRSGSSAFMQVGSTVSSTFTPTTVTGSDIEIGRVNASFGHLDGAICEMIGYKEAQTTVPRNATISALKTKWGIA